MKSSGLKNAVIMSHYFMENYIESGSVVVDATCGRGQDTLFLARLVGETGKVYAFDIQDTAIKSTHSLLEAYGFLDRVSLIKDNHIHLADYLSGIKPKVCIFNLGYLPEGDHTIVTSADTTVKALQAALDILAVGGLISMVFYTGHNGGPEEYEAVCSYLSQLSQSVYEVMEMAFLNQINNPPRCIVVHKLSEGEI